MTAPAQRPVDGEAADRGEVARLGPKSVRVEARDRRVADPRPVEPVQLVARRLADPAGLIFPPGLVRRHLLRLSRPDFAAELLLALPSLPGEFVIVPDADERPARAGVLQIGVGQIGAIGRAIVLEGGGQMKSPLFLAVRIADQFAQPAATLHAARTVLRIEDDLVDEIAEMKDKTHPVLRVSVFRPRRSCAARRSSRPGSGPGS